MEIRSHAIIYKTLRYLYRVLKFINQISAALLIFTFYLITGDNKPQRGNLFLYNAFCLDNTELGQSLHVFNDFRYVKFSREIGAKREFQRKSSKNNIILDISSTEHLKTV